MTATMSDEPSPGAPDKIVTAQEKSLSVKEPAGTLAVAEMTPSKPSVSPAQQNEQDKAPSLWRIVDLAKPEWVWLSIGMVFLIISLLPPLLLPLMFGKLMDEIMITRDDSATGQSTTKPDQTKREDVNTLAAQLMILLTIGAVATMVRSFIFNAAGERVVARLRFKLFSAIVCQEVAMFDERKTGELMSRLTSDCTSLQDVSTSNLSMFLRGIIELALSAVMMVLVSWRLSVLAFCVVPFVGLALTWYGWRVQKVSTLATDALGESSNTAQEAISNVRTMRSFAAEKLEVLRFRRTLGDPDAMGECQKFDDSDKNDSQSEKQRLLDKDPQRNGHTTIEMQNVVSKESSILTATAVAGGSSPGARTNSASKESLRSSSNRDQNQLVGPLVRAGEAPLEEDDPNATQGVLPTTLDPDNYCGCCLPNNETGCCWFPPRKSKTVYRFAILKQMLNAGFIAVVSVLGYGVTNLVIWYGAHLVLDGRMTPGELIAFLVYAVQVGGSISLLVHLIAILYQALGAAKRTFQLIDRKPKILVTVEDKAFYYAPVMEDHNHIVFANNDKSQQYSSTDPALMTNTTTTPASANVDHKMIVPVVAPPNHDLELENGNSSTTVSGEIEVVVDNGARMMQNSTADLEPSTTQSSKPPSNMIVEFQNVSFCYPARPDIRVLKRVTFQIPRYQTVAFVGHSGGGKSTIINLIQRFYDCSGGQILLEGKNVQDYDHASLRKNFAWVQQEPVLFGVSILENIAYGSRAQELHNKFVLYNKENGKTLKREEVSEEEKQLSEEKLKQEVMRCAKLAFAHDFIMQFPEGYDTLVGERGVRLSGGQKQRIAIARALMSNPNILLLDEATSALDAESEALVQKAIDQLVQHTPDDGKNGGISPTKNKTTTLIVAHRLSTVRRADQIFFLDRNRLVAQGTHDELMERCEKYKDLVKRQIETSREERESVDVDDSVPLQPIAE
ncbi:unnamed protein product [Amoebophrya sp. A120]|nr:unnamed protein product [Amoebophrya sp. A120]|eukprot:GSA120T00012560001.1